MFHLRIDRLLDLAGGERDDDKNKRGNHDPFCRKEESAAPGLADNPQEGERDEQPEPDVTRSAGFMIREPEREERQRARPPAPQSSDGQRKNQKQKQIQKRPRSQPVAMNPVRAEESKQPPAGRKVERHPQRFGIGLPAARGNFFRAPHAAVRLDVHFAGADFNTGRAGHRAARDELSAAIATHRTEILALARIKPPDFLHLAGEPVAERECLSTLVEPPLAGDGKTRSLLKPHAAHPFLDVERSRRVPAVNRQLAPLLRKSNLRHINRRVARDFDHAEIRT